jgi:hypothetical protein
MAQACTIRRQVARPIYQPRNTGSGFGLQYAGVLSLSAVVIMPLFMSLGGHLNQVFSSIGTALLGA